jgi:hypothetical protein
MDRPNRARADASRKRECQHGLATPLGSWRGSEGTLPEREAKWRNHDKTARDRDRPVRSGRQGGSPVTRPARREPLQPCDDRPGQPARAGTMSTASVVIACLGIQAFVHAHTCKPPPAGERHATELSPTANLPVEPTADTSTWDCARGRRRSRRLRLSFSTMPVAITRRCRRVRPRAATLASVR